MNRAELFFLRYCWFIIITISVLYYLTLEKLIHDGNSPPSVLFSRGVVTFLLTALISIKNKKQLLPSKVSRQLLRVIISGVALWLFFESYRSLEASTVCMIARLDIPFAVLISLILGKKAAHFKIYLSILSVLLVLSIFLFADHINQGWQGIALGVVSVFMVSVSYNLVKQSTRDEGDYVIVNSTNLGCIVVGLITGFLIGNLHMIHFDDIPVLILASICQFLLNYIMSLLYRQREIEHAQRPYLVSSIVLLGVEQVFHGFLFDFHHDLVIVLVAAIIYLITLKQLPDVPAWLNKRRKLIIKETDFEADYRN